AELRGPMTLERRRQIHVDHRREADLVRLGRQIRRKNHLDDGRQANCAEQDLEKFYGRAFPAPAPRPEHFLKMLSRPRAALIGGDLFFHQRAALEPRAAIVAIDSFRLVLVLAIRADEFRHEAESFFGLASGCFAGVAAGAGLLSALPGE